ncbi:hypothetical protein ACIRYZ_43925 [Kitasatospora sp. NPDC101155]|uniref:hypothetical protein n=1 Tax=Kitasatospora sp. NPDC101155 TaxID=3364097 RepID=UPI003824C874
MTDNAQEAPQTALQGLGGDAEPRPVLSPEEFSKAPLTPEERDRRADLLARLREANHPWR